MAQPPAPPIDEGPGSGSASVQQTAEPDGTKRAERPNERLALLVGINGYQGDLAPLNFCARDMRALAWVLTTHGGYRKENVRLLVDEGQADGPPTKESILDGLREWVDRADLAKDDTVLFAFSGHGFSDHGQAYLMPSGSDTAALTKTALPVEQVYELLDKSNAGQCFLVVDACRNGFTRSAASAERVLPSQFARQNSAVCQLFSCDDGEVSIEDKSLESMLPGEKGHGVFTHYLVRGLAGDADENNDHTITLAEVFGHTSKRVNEYVARRNEREKSKLKQTVNRAGKQAGVLRLAEYVVPPSQELSSMPGLGGGWWFDEAPWLLPLLRPELSLHVAELKAGPDNKREFLRDANALEVYARLQAGFDAHVQNQPLEWRSALRQIVASQRADKTSAPDRVARESAKGYWEQIRALSVDKRRGKRASAMHTLAVLHHQEFVESRREESRNAARQHYVDAIRLYEKFYDERGLHARCLADFGLFQEAIPDRARAVASFEQARKTVKPEAATLLHVECLIHEGNSRRKLNEFAKARECYEAAYNLCSDMTEVGNAHPLAITAMKQKGWCFMDEWRVKGAGDAFRQARDRSQDHRKLNPLTEKVIDKWVAEFHIEHGIALCDRYGGQLQSATTKYVALIEKVESKLNEWDPDDPRLDTLQNRLANTYERLGDCYLQAANSNAVSTFQLARDTYKELGLSSLTSRLRNQCKLAISRIVAEDDFQRARQDLKELHELREARPDSRTFEEIVQYEEIAGCLLEAERDLDPLRELVALPANETKLRDKLNRDEIDVFLVAARELLRRSPEDDRATPWLVEQLYDMIPPRQGAKRKESLAYRREYYDVGLVAWLKQKNPDLDTLIDRIVQAKTNNRYGLKSDKNILVFYFPKRHGQQGYCVWRKRDRSGNVFPLGIGWDKLGAEHAVLPDEVLQALREVDETIEVQWLDRVESLGLCNDNDPPFLLEDIDFYSKQL